MSKKLPRVHEVKFLHDFRGNFFSGTFEIFVGKIYDGKIKLEINSVKDIKFLNYNL